MYLNVWEFVPRAGKELEFEKAYGSGGDWAQLFANSSDYRGTDLLQSTTNRSYLTVDRWASATAFTEFKRRWQAEYQTLDHKMGLLTDRETQIGEYELV